MHGPGDSLLHYRLVERIGGGASGEVWKATDTKLGRELAIRILPPDVGPEALERLQRAAEILEAANHHGIVAIDSVGEADGAHFICLELVHGTPLFGRIPAGGLTLDRFLELALPLTDAVRAAHERGVVHGDLRPGKVLLCEDGRLRVLDFGLGALHGREFDASVDPDEIPTLTLTHDGPGRDELAYRSPESIRAKPLDERSDVFSLGTILYEMATGERAFEQVTAADTVVAILRDSPRPIGELNGTLPVRVAQIVAQCLAKEPERRFPSAAELHAELFRLHVA
jgi:serine/threonine protein kinase